MEIITGAAASYNSLVHQVAFCKLQGFDTISRSTSAGPRMFMDGRIRFGVGLSNVQFNNTVSSCGRCIEIHSIHNLARMNDELTAWYDDDDDWTTSIIAQVFDQCKDPVCESGYLDFDIYSSLQPVHNGNPFNASWSFIPCPTTSEDTLGILVCLSDACLVDAPRDRTAIEVVADSSPYFWSLFVRNHRWPIDAVRLADESQTALADENGWIYNGPAFDFTRPFVVEILSAGVWRSITVDLLRHEPSPDYRGGFLLEANL